MGGITMAALQQIDMSVTSQQESSLQQVASPPGLFPPPGLGVTENADFSAARLRADSDNFLLSQLSARHDHATLVQHHMAQQHVAARLRANSDNLLLSQLAANQGSAELALVRQHIVQQQAARLRANSDNFLLSQISATRDPGNVAAAQQAFAQQILFHQLQAQGTLVLPDAAATWPSSATGNLSKGVSHGDSRSTSVDSREAANVDAPSSESASGSSGEDGPAKTTVMMRNIPNSYTRGMLLQLVDRHGFSGTYDLVYLPMDFASNAAFGYAFLNFTSVVHAHRFRQHFDGFRKWDVSSGKTCEVSWGSTHQGLEANVERYRNCPVMHPSVSDEFKPAVFIGGMRVPFPTPTKKGIAPKVSARRQ